MNEKQTKGNILITIKKSSNDLERNKTKERKKENTWRRQNENWKEKPKKKPEEKRKTHNEEAKSYPKKKQNSNEGTKSSKNIWSWERNTNLSADDQTRANIYLVCLP